MKSNEKVTTATVSKTTKVKGRARARLFRSPYNHGVFIKRIELRQIRLPLLYPFETSVGRTTERHIIVVRVFDRSGESGWGECVADENPYYSEEWTGSAWPALETFIAPLVAGASFESAEDVEGRFAHIRGNRMAKAAVETACWDLDARLRGVPLWKLLGGTRNEIP